MLTLLHLKSLYKLRFHWWQTFEHTQGAVAIKQNIKHFFDRQSICKPQKKVKSIKELKIPDWTLWLIGRTVQKSWICWIKIEFFCGFKIWFHQQFVTLCHTVKTIEPKNQHCFSTFLYLVSLGFISSSSSFRCCCFMSYHFQPCTKFHRLATIEQSFVLPLQILFFWTIAWPALNNHQSTATSILVVLLLAVFPFQT